VRVRHHEGVRHLSEQQALAALHRGAAIEQMLTRAETPSTIEWLRLSPGASGVVMTRHRVEDLRGMDRLDIYEFPSVDPDEAHGEGAVLGRFARGVEALAESATHGAHPDRWVNDGVIQDEYADLIRH
jgi:hypothetical protein